VALVLKEIDFEVAHLIHVAECGPLRGSCEQDYEISDFIKGRTYLNVRRRVTPYFKLVNDSPYLYFMLRNSSLIKTK
jgi:hypothetical protein